MSLARLQQRWAHHREQPPFREGKIECKLCHHLDDVCSFKQFKVNDIFHAGQLVRYQCPQCDVVFGDLRFLNLTRDEIDQDYTDLYSFYAEGNTTKYILECLRRYVQLEKDKTYLDYGCGKWNNHIEILSGEGYAIYGYDQYVKGAGKNILKHLPEEVTFDVVLSNNFIEHVIEPLADIARLLTHVKSGGKLVLITPCFEYKYDFTHYHTFFFLGRSICYLEAQLNIKLLQTYEVNFADGERTIIKIFVKP